MKKTVIVLILLVAGVAGYYFAIGSDQATNLLKTQVDSQLNILQQNGFAVENRKKEKTKESFVLHYADPAKINFYLQQHNIDISPEDAQTLKGFKIATELSYQEGVYSAVSADIYPVAFPDAVMQEATPQDRKMMKKILDEKILLAHVDINKIFTAFKGYLKDINTTFESEDPISVVSQGISFDGTLDAGTAAVTSSQNAVKQFDLQTKSGTKFAVRDLRGMHEQKGPTGYDFASDYSIGGVTIYDEKGIGGELTQLAVKTYGKVQGGIATSGLAIGVEDMQITEAQGRRGLKSLSLQTTLENLSVAALDKIAALDGQQDKEAFNTAIKDLISGGITLKVDKLSAQNILDTQSGKMIDGFNSNALFAIAKNADSKALSQDPSALLGLVDAKMHLELSDALYQALQSDPEIAMGLMFLQPVSNNGTTVFDILFKQGVLTVNGKPVL